MAERPKFEYLISPSGVRFIFITPTPDADTRYVFYKHTWFWISCDKGIREKLSSAIERFAFVQCAPGGIAYELSDRPATSDPHIADIASTVSKILGDIHFVVDQAHGDIIPSKIIDYLDMLFVVEQAYADGVIPGERIEYLDKKAEIVATSAQRNRWYDGLFTRATQEECAAIVALSTLFTISAVYIAHSWLSAVPYLAQ